LNASNASRIGDVDRRRAHGRLGGGARLDQHAEFDHVAHELRVGLRTKPPAHDVFIDHPPIAHRPNPRADFGTHVEHVARQQHRQCFAHDRAADVELFRQHILRRQNAAVLVLDDTRDKSIHHFSDQ
jgi:hypothetical protein